MSAAFEVPVIETERLRLRGRTVEDFAFIRDMWADPVTTKFIGGAPLSEEASWTKFLRMMGHWPALGFGYWLVEDKASGTTLGEAGFGEFKRGVEPSIKGMPEMGWALAPFAHGKGYAGEAVRAALAWGDDHFSGDRVCCIISPGNAPSIRLAEKVGFVKVAPGNYNGEATLIFERKRPRGGA